MYTKNKEKSRGRGRPPKTNGTALTETITLKVTLAEKELYNTIAEVKNTDVSKLIRESMQESCNKSLKELEKMMGNLKKIGISIQD